MGRHNAHFLSIHAVHLPHQDRATTIYSSLEGEGLASLYLWFDWDALQPVVCIAVEMECWSQFHLVPVLFSPPYTPTHLPPTSTLTS